MYLRGFSKNLVHRARIGPIPGAKDRCKIALRCAPRRLAPRNSEVVEVDLSATFIDVERREFSSPSHRRGPTVCGGSRYSVTGCCSRAVFILNDFVTRLPFPGPQGQRTDHVGDIPQL